MTGKLFFTGDEKGEHPGPAYFRDKNDDVITSFTFTSRRPKVAIFADIMKIVTMFINNIFLNSKKVHIKTQSISVFLDRAKFSDFWWENADVSRIQGMCHVIHLYFLDLL